MEKSLTFSPKCSSNRNKQQHNVRYRTVVFRNSNKFFTRHEEMEKSFYLSAVEFFCTQPHHVKCKIRTQNKFFMMQP